MRPMTAYWNPLSVWPTKDRRLRLPWEAKYRPEQIQSEPMTGILQVPSWTAVCRFAVRGIGNHAGQHADSEHIDTLVS